MLLQVSNINKTYGDKKILDDISFSCNKGQMLCLLGPSGCGKSTLLNLIGGFEKEDSGKIYLEGVEINGLGPEERNISTVFQSYGLFYHMTVYQNIAYGLKFKNLKKDQIKEMVREMIKSVELEGHEDKYMNQISGGQRQRVALARSLIIKPKLLLLDEPLSNLDQKLRVAMRTMIKKIQKDLKMTMIFVTHDQNEAFEIADKVILMNQGKLIQEDAPLDLYRKPKTKFSLDFIGEKNIFPDGYARYENVKLVDKSDLEGQIVDIIFQGSLIELSLETKLGLIKSYQLSNNFNKKIGDTVYLQIEKDALLKA